MCMNTHTHTHTHSRTMFSVYKCDHIHAFSEQCFLYLTEGCGADPRQRGNLQSGWHMGSEGMRSRQLERLQGQVWTRFCSWRAALSCLILFWVVWEPQGWELPGRSWCGYVHSMDPWRQDERRWACYLRQ